MIKAFAIGACAALQVALGLVLIVAAVSPDRPPLVIEPAVHGVASLAGALCLVTSAFLMTSSAP